MKKIWIILLLIFFPPYLYSDLQQLYSQKLARDLSYIQALLQLKSAELELSYYEKNYIPSISLRTDSSRTGSGGINLGQYDLGITDGKFGSYAISTQLVFEKIFGTTIQFSLPYVWDSEEGHRISTPMLTISRQLFEEDESGRLEAKAGVLQNETRIKEIRAGVLTGLVMGILDKYYNVQSEKIYSEYIDVLESSLQSAKTDDQRTALKRKMYSIQKLYLNAQYVKDTSDQEIPGGMTELDSLYTQVCGIALEIEQDIQQFSVPSPDRKDIEALELLLQAARKKAGFWFLPFVPNPTFYASLAYNIQDNLFHWGIGLSVTVPLLDHGERDLASRSRKQGEVIARITLLDKQDNYNALIRGLQHKTDLLKIDIEILELDREDADQEYRDSEKLYEKGIINETDYKLAKLDYELAELSLADKRGEYYLSLFALFTGYGMDIGRFIK